MTKKMALPDELLDALSGGTVTVHGQVVADFSVEEDRYLVTTKGGDRYEMKFGPDESAFAKSYFSVSVEQRMKDPGTHALNPDSFTKVG